MSHFQVERSLSRGKRHRDLEIEQILSEKRNLHAYLVQKAEVGFQGECAAQKRFSEAEAEMDRRNWERRNADIALCKHVCTCGRPAGR